MASAWYCAGFIKNKEALAIQHLERQDYRVFCPRFLKTVSHARKKTQKLAPLFPGYLFVKLDIANQRWRPIDGTLGVTHIVKSAGLPARVAPGFMSRLLASADATGRVHFEDRFAPGDRVRVVGGALDNTVATLLRLAPDERVVVLMNMLGREVEVTVPRGQLLKAS